MRILLINPNTSEDFTTGIEATARRYALPTTEVVAMNPAAGPRSIESMYDELLSAPGTLQLLLKEEDNFDAFVIACYGNHSTTYAAREITRKPVLEISEASMYVACMLGHKFSIISTNAEWGPIMWNTVRQYGLTDRCASVRTAGMPVLALESDSKEAAYRPIRDEARRAIEEDGAEVICLGCAGMVDLDKELEKELDVPVLDGVICALKLLEGVLGYGVRTSTRLSYAQPGPKELLNLPPIFNKPYRSE